MSALPPPLPPPLSTLFGSLVNLLQCDVLLAVEGAVLQWAVEPSGGCWTESMLQRVRLKQKAPPALWIAAFHPNTVFKSISPSCCLFIRIFWKIKCYHGITEIFLRLSVCCSDLSGTKPSFCSLCAGASPGGHGFTGRAAAAGKQQRR